MQFLKPHQKEGVEWMVGRETCEATTFHDDIMPSGGILADEVGLGKTIQTIGLLQSLPKKSLIIAPKSLVLQWIDEIHKFAPDMRIINLTRAFDTTHLTDDCTYIISSSYFNKSTAVVGATPLHKMKWGRIIIDESHSIKNKKAKLHQSVCCLTSEARWCLTATPVMNKMDDFINLTTFIGLSKFVTQGYRDDVVKTFLKRRTKEDVKHQDEALRLPKLNIEVCRMPFANEEEKKLYKDVFNDTNEQMRKKTNTNAIELLEMLLRVRQVCAYPQCYVDGMKRKFKMHIDNWSHDSTKIPKITDDVLKVRDQKSIIFCQFRKEMRAYKKSLEDHGMKSVSIHGLMSMEERSESIETFKNTNTNVIIIQIHTGGQGYNLQNAQNVFITSPTWNPCIEYQAIGRAHRTGQKNDVKVKRYIISDETDTDTVYIEENMLAIHDKKRKIAADTLNDDRLAVDHAVYNTQAPLKFTDIRSVMKKQ